MAPSVGIIAYSLERSAGGIGRYTRELITALRRTAVQLTVLEASHVVTDREAVHLPGAGLLPGLLSVGQAEIAYSSWRHKLDLVHDPTGVMAICLSGSRRVVTIHDVFPYVHPSTSTTADRLIYRFWLPIAIRRADAVLTDSENSMLDILRFLPVAADKITVVPAAASDRYRLLKPEIMAPVLRKYRIEQPYLLYVGSIEPRKNIIRLLQAFAILRKEFPQWKLVIVGVRNTWITSSIGEEIERLNIKPWIQFPGFVAEEDLPAVFNGADLFVFPSLYEGFGLPVLEAMRCGTPVITSNISSLPEVAGNAALLVNPYDVDEIASAVARILQDKALKERLKFNGLEQAGKFSWERTAHETVNVYNKVLGCQ